MGIAAKLKLNEAKIGAGGIYFEPKPDGSKGTYKVRIEKVAIVERRNNAGDLFVVETTILESDVPSRKPGSRCSYAMKVEIDAAASNIKAFFAAATGVDPNNEEAMRPHEEGGEDWDAIMETSLEDDQPLKGNEIYIEALHKEGKTAKKDSNGNLFLPTYTLCRFRPAE